MQYSPIVEEQGGHMRRLCCGRRYCACYFGIAILGEEDVLFASRRFRKRSKNILLDECEGFSCYKELKFALMAVKRIILCAVLAFPQ